MIIRELIVDVDGTQHVRERELTPAEEQAASKLIEPPDPMESVDAMLVDHEYRLTLMELGITDFNMEV